MIESIKFWNEPNNKSHWDIFADPQWKDYARMTSLAAERVRELCPELTLVLGGMSPIDPSFLELLATHGVLDHLDVVAVHGFPLDWNHWRLDDWPRKIAEIEAVTSLPVWVTEVGVSSFGADEVQAFGLERTQQLLLDRVERVYWYSLLDLPPAWEATTRHRESEGSSYYRHFYMGLIRDDRTPKLALDCFDPRMGICQWFHFEDHRLELAVEWMKRLGVRRVRTGLSWADWLRPDAEQWFDRMMEALADFDVMATLCFTPEARGRQPHHTSVPQRLEEYADFAQTMVERYVIPDRSATREVTAPQSIAGTV
jgi:beta-xylosidase